MSKIFIIGMPGSGKSTIGELLAEKMELSFFDLDKVIEEGEQKSIPSIFQDQGESYFREVESRYLKEITQRNNSFVMATGGGAPCFHQGLEWMSVNGISVFIDVNPDILIQRVKQQERRPLLKGDVDERIQQLYNERISIYSKAQITVEADILSVTGLAERLVEELKT